MTFVDMKERERGDRNRIGAEFTFFFHARARGSNIVLDPNILALVCQGA